MALPSLAVTATRSVVLPVPLAGTEITAHAESLVAVHAQSGRLAESVSVAVPDSGETVCLGGVKVKLQVPVCAVQGTVRTVTM